MDKNIAKITLFLLFFAQTAVGQLLLPGQRSTETARDGSSPSSFAGIMRQWSPELNGAANTSLILGTRIPLDSSGRLRGNITSVVGRLDLFEQLFIGGGVGYFMMGDADGGLFVEGNVGFVQHVVGGGFFATALSSGVGGNVGTSLYVKPFSSLPTISIGVSRWYLPLAITYTPWAANIAVHF